MRFHLYLSSSCSAFTRFLFLFFFSPYLFDLQLLFLTTCQKVIKGVGWVRWPPRSFANPIWQSAPLDLHWSAIVQLCFHLLQCSLMVGLLNTMAFMVLLLVGWVIWYNKPPHLHFKIHVEKLFVVVLHFECQMMMHFSCQTTQILLNLHINLWGEILISYFCL